MNREDELVSFFADKTRRNEAIVALIGGITATELRRVKVTDAAFEALVRGLKHPNAKVRWWCLQLMDHVADTRFLPAMREALDDPIPKVRRHAIHALTCDICKQDGHCEVDPETRRKIERMVSDDPDEKVRAEALHVLALI